MRIGVYGGSFDPFHSGHLAMIKSALKSGMVDCVIAVPSVCNSFKRYTSVLPAPYRYYMVKDTVESLGLKNVYTSDVEFGIEGVSYTVLTLKALTDPKYIRGFLEDNGVKSKKASEDHDFYWLMGSDTLATFEQWYKPGEILDYVTLLVAARPGDDTDIEACARSVRNSQPLAAPKASVNFRSLVPRDKTSRSNGFWAIRAGGSVSAPFRHRVQGSS